MNADQLNNLKIMAMYSVIEEPSEYNIRYIFRWFSREFSTPLHVVETLPLEDVLTHYYECLYEDQSSEDRQATIDRLLMTPEQLAARRRAEDAEDAEAWEFGQEAIKSAPATPNPDMPVAPVDPITERIERIRASMRPPEVLPGTETQLPPSAPVVEEGIHIEFEDLDIPEVPDAPSFGPTE